MAAPSSFVSFADPPSCPFAFPRTQTFASMDTSSSTGNKSSASGSALSRAFELTPLPPLSAFAHGTPGSSPQWTQSEPPSSCLYRGDRTDLLSRPQHQYPRHREIGSSGRGEAGLRQGRAVMPSRVSLVYFAKTRICSFCNQSTVPSYFHNSLSRLGRCRELELGARAPLPSCPPLVSPRFFDSRGTESSSYPPCL